MGENDHRITDAYIERRKHAAERSNLSKQDLSDTNSLKNLSPVDLISLSDEYSQGLTTNSENLSSNVTKTKPKGEMEIV